MILKNNNFRNFFLGRVTLNFSDSLYLIVISVAIVTVYNLGIKELSVFGLLSFIPSLINILFSPFLVKIKNFKGSLLFLQILQIITLIVIVLILTFKIHFLFLFGFHFLFTLVNSLIYPLENSFLPSLLNHNQKLIDESVNYMYLSKNLVDVISNMISSLLLLYITVSVLLNINILLFLVAILFFIKIKPDIQPEEKKELGNEKRYTSLLVESYNIFKSQKTPMLIVYMEGILSGLTTMMMKIIPIYLLVIDIDVKYLGVLIACQKGSEFLGAIVSMNLKSKEINFFILDYLVSGVCLILCLLVPYIPLKLLFFSLVFFVIGISGNVYEKMIYRYYEYKDIGRVSSVIYTISSAMIVFSFLLPFIIENSIILITIVGFVTFIFGIILTSYKCITR
ncbi:hypothetical protein [Mammaliicoccus sciuri]|uniref:hypothetical protein n=1 Tax=Mammaliicoccus sciuri TaxID=1296 RepID=UPI003F57162E